MWIYKLNNSFIVLLRVQDNLLVNQFLLHYKSNLNLSPELFIQFEERKRFKHDLGHRISPSCNYKTRHT